MMFCVIMLARAYAHARSFNYAHDVTCESFRAQKMLIVQVISIIHN